MPRLNKPAIEGYRYAHPEETSARSYTPHLEEDVARSQRSDAERIRRGLNTAETRNAANRLRQQEAAGRAITRTLGRAGYAGSALAAGYDAGRELDEATGIGKKLVDRTVGKAIDRAIQGSEDRVKLTKEAKARQKQVEEAEQDLADASEGYARGGKIGSASRRADGIAQRGKTKGRMI